MQNNSFGNERVEENISLYQFSFWPPNLKKMALLPKMLYSLFIAQQKRNKIANSFGGEGNKCNRRYRGKGIRFLKDGREKITHSSREERNKIC